MSECRKQSACEWGCSGPRPEPDACAAPRLFIECRRPLVINLDPANDELPYPCALDIADLISCSDVMEAMELGPNGGLMYCMDFLAENMSWLDERVQALQRESGGSENLYNVAHPLTSEVLR